MASTAEPITRPGSRPALPRSGAERFLMGAAVAVGLGILGLSAFIFVPMAKDRPAESAQPPVTVPAYAYDAWAAFPVQHEGRIKPFETAAIEILRQVTGRSKFQEHKAVPVVLQWMFLQGAGQGSELTEWDNYRFILCDHHGVRKWVYAHKIDGWEDLVRREQIPELLAKADTVLSEEERHGKYISPRDLRDSPSYKMLLASAREIQQRDPEKGSQYFSPEQAQGLEVDRRLKLYERVTQSGPVSPMMGRQPEPFQFIVLDRVKGAPWFSRGQVKEIQQDPGPRWQEVIKERLAKVPQDYLSPDRQKDLAAFRDRIRAGQGKQAIDELKPELARRREAAAAELPRRQEEALKTFAGRFPQAEVSPAKAFVDVYATFKPVVGDEGLSELKQWFTARAREAQADPQGSGNVSVAAIVEQLRKTCERSAKRIAAKDAVRDEETVAQLQTRLDLAQKKSADPTDPHYRTLELDYLEARSPNLYQEAVAWQKFPAEDARAVLAAFDQAQAAFKSNDPAQFDQASTDFFAAVHAAADRATADGLALSPAEPVREAASRYRDALTSDDAGRTAETQQQLRSALTAAHVNPVEAFYPGTNTLDLERTYNRVQPFMWAWIVMLPALILFGVSYGTGSRVAYLLGFAAYLTSLAMQVFGFYCRISIAGRPPVSNMYETVIFVAAMSAIFALVLELIYRRTLFVLAGSMVGTVALVLADQMPLAMDPKISPLVPVLRSNFWLIIHVMTVVSSYAGGTLAWGVGNLALGLLAFGSPRKETLKMLSQFTRRGLEIAVLLLATGTFLGGWWAAYSWGRFWGWDPKETWALIALVCYVIPLHMRYIGWVKDFGLAVSAVLCYAAIMMSWYGVNFVLGTGLHAYGGVSGGGPWWMFWVGLINVEWVIVASLIYLRKQQIARQQPTAELAGV